MTALADDIQRTCFGPSTPLTTGKAAANQVFFQGSIVSQNPADGMHYVGAPAATYKVLGTAAGPLDTTGLAAGARDVVIQPGILGYFASATAADLIEEDDRWKDCYVVDDDTVALTSATNTRARAGTIYDVTADGVVVQFEVIRYG